MSHNIHKKEQNWEDNKRKEKSLEINIAVIMKRKCDIKVIFSSFTHISECMYIIPSFFPSPLSLFLFIFFSHRPFLTYLLSSILFLNLSLPSFFPSYLPSFLPSFLPTYLPYFLSFFLSFFLSLNLSLSSFLSIYLSLPSSLSIYLCLSLSLSLPSSLSIYLCLSLSLSLFTFTLSILLQCSFPSSDINS